MPMNAFPPGGPPGIPPAGGPPSGGGWGPPPGGGGGFGPPSGGGGYGTPPPGGGGYGTPPPGGFPPQQPAPKSKTGLYVGIGCGCLLLLACIGGGVAVWAVGKMGPGDEVQSAPITPGQPFTLSYVQSGSQKYEAWLEVDLTYSAGYNLNGTLLLSENGSAFGQYTLTETGSGSPIQERSSSTRINWVSSNLNGSGSASGKVSLFPIPARSAGGTVTISGTISAPAGTTGTIRLFVAERD